MGVFAGWVLGLGKLLLGFLVVKDEDELDNNDADDFFDRLQ